jgi:D-alanyl-D-alanine carboxypeptidase
MRKKCKDLCNAIIAALILVCAALPCTAQEKESLNKQIDKIIRHDTELSFEQVPGIIIGIIDGDSTYILTRGVRSLESGSAITSEDVFELGSLTKPLTAHILLKLYAQNRLELEDPLNKYLPIAYQNPNYEATIRQVIMHQSGIPKIPETLGSTEIDISSPYSGFTKEALLTWYRDLQPGPLNEFRYSHSNYGLLEVVIEQITDEPFHKVFQRYISESYGLPQTHAHTVIPVNPGYDLARRETNPWAFQSFRASEGAISNLSDLLVYTRALLEDESIPVMWNSFEETDEKRLQIGFGWYRLLAKKNFPVYVHTGHTSGHSAMIAFSRKTKTGVIILANSVIGTHELGLLILRMINRQWKRKN